MAPAWRLEPDWRNVPWRVFAVLQRSAEVGTPVEEQGGMELMRSEPALPPSKEKPEGAERSTVLVVDDERGIVDSLHKILERESLRVLTAGSGGEALDLVRREPVS